MRYRIWAAGTLLYDSYVSLPQYSVLEPKCKRERGKAGTVSFGLVPTHPLYNSLNRLTTEIVVNEDEKEIFRGRVYEIETDIWRQKNVTCEGDLSYLVDSLQPPDRHDKKNEDDVTSTTPNPWGDDSKTTTKTYTYIEQEGTKETVANHLRRLINTHNNQVDTWKRFTVGNIAIDEADTEVTFDASNYRETMNAIDSDIINYYGGYLKTRRVGNATYLDYVKENSGATASQTINFGKNMIEMSESLTSDEIFTVLVPIGDDNLTIASVNNNSVEIQNAQGVAKYGKIYKTESFSGVDSAAKLKSLAEKYMTKNYKADPVKFSITALDLKNLGVNVDPFDIGYKIHVFSPPHGIDRTLECLSIEVSMDAPEKTTFEIGDPDTTLSERYKKDSDKNANDAADANSSARSAGGGGGQLFKLLKEQGQTLQFLGDTIDFTKDKVTINANELVIHANKIETNAKMIDAHEAKLAVFSVSASGVVVSTSLVAQGGIVGISSLSGPQFNAVNGMVSIKGHDCSWLEKEIVIGGDISVGLDTSGTYISGKYALTNARVSFANFSPETETIHYLGM